MPIDPVTGAAILTGGAALTQGLVSSAFNMSEASKNRRFQERLSTSAHQREVIDLKKAGLNPILSSKYGGSSTPPGSSAQAQSPDIAQAITSGRKVGQDQELMRAQIEDINSSKSLKDAQTNDIFATQKSRIDSAIASMVQSLSSGNLNEQAKLKVIQEIKNLEEQRKLLKIDIISSGLELSKKKVTRSLYEVGAKAIDEGKKFIPKVQQKWNEAKQKNSGRTGRW